MTDWEFVEFILKISEKENEKEKRNIIKISIAIWLISLIVGIVIGYYIK